MASLAERIKAATIAENGGSLSERVARATEASSAVANEPRTVTERANRDFGFDDLAYRGSILPFGRTKEGKTELATPGVIKDMMTSAMLPGHVAQGGDFSAQDVAKFTLDYGMPATSRTRMTTGGKVAPTQKEFVKRAPSKDDLAKASGDMYTAARGSGVVVKPDSYQNFIDDVQSSLTRTGFDEDLHPAIATTLKVWRKQEGQPMDIQALDIARQQVKDAMASNEPGIRRLGHIMQDKLDDYVDKLKASDLLVGGADDAETAARTIRNARGLWAKSRKVDTIDTLLENAQMQASGFENGIRIGLRAILKNPKKLRGFTDDEVKLMREIVDGSTPQKITRLLGKFSLIRSDAGNMFGGTIGVGGGAGIGGSIAGPPGAVVGGMIPPMVGYAGQKSAEASTLGKAQLLRAMAGQGKALPGQPVDQRALIQLLLKGAGPIAGALQGEQGGNR